MKKLLIITIIMAGLSVQAQRQGHHGPHKANMSDMTPEQIATLKTKRLDLRLGLNDEQQTKIMALELQQAQELKALMEERKNKEGATKEIGTDERFNRQNERLDRQLAYKEAMKNILTEEQYGHWEKIRSHRKGKRHHHKDQQRREGK